MVQWKICRTKASQNSLEWLQKNVQQGFSGRILEEYSTTMQCKSVKSTQNQTSVEVFLENTVAQFTGAVSE